MARFARLDIPYAALLGVSFVLALAASWTAVAIDNNAYDWMFRMYRPEPWQPESALLAIDQDSLRSIGGLRNMRAPLARALASVTAARPKAVIIDLILAEPSDEASDAALESAFRAIPNLVLPCELHESGTRWEEPLPRFAKWAKAVAHVHAEPDRLDAVSRAIPLEKQTARERRWAMSLEALRVSRGGGAIMESPEDLQVAGISIPARLGFVLWPGCSIREISLEVVIHIQDATDLSEQLWKKFLLLLTLNSMVRSRVMNSISRQD